MLSQMNSWTDVLTSSNLSTLYNFSKDLASELNQIFLETVQVGKMTGKLLAHYLAADPYFESKSISLVGYSLGCQVLKSALNRIRKLHRKDLIHNVLFLAGAANFDQTKG